MNYLISAFIFLTSTAYISGKSFGDTQLNVLKIGIPIIWLVSLCMKPKRSVQNIWLNALVGLCFITTLFLKGQPKNIAIEPLICVFLVTILYYTLSNYLDDINPILNGLCWAIGAHAVIVFLQGVNLDPICIMENGKPSTHFVGLFGCKFVFGAWMAIVTPMLLFNKRYLWGGLSFIMCILSMSVAPIGLMLASLLTGVLIHSRKHALWAITGVIIVGVIAWVGVLNKPHNQSLYQKATLRLTLETKFLPIIFQKPLTGYGLGSFKYIGPQIWNPSTGPYGTMVDAWNDYLQQAVETGLGFIVLFLGMCLAVLKRFKRALKTPQLIGIFCSLMIIPFGILFHNYFGHASLGVLMISILSAFEING